jgi:hypothetical protein
VIEMGVMAVIAGFWRIRMPIAKWDERDDAHDCPQPDEYFTITGAGTLGHKVEGGMDCGIRQHTKRSYQRVRFQCMRDTGIVMIEPAIFRHTATSTPAMNRMMLYL